MHQHDSKVITKTGFCKKWEERKDKKQILGITLAIYFKNGRN